MSLLSCGYDNVLSQNWDAYRGVRPVNSTSCECYDTDGISCVAWCTNTSVSGFEIAAKGGSAIFQGPVL
jgi:hypothetical protein